MALSRGQALSQPTVVDSAGLEGGTITLRDADVTPVEISFKVADIQTDSYNITLPTTLDGAGWSGYVMTFSESGGEVTSVFGPVTATPGGADGSIQYNNGGSLSGSATVDYIDTGTLEFRLNYDGSSNPTYLSLYDNGASNFARFYAPSDITRNYSVQLPALIPGTVDGDADGYVLKITSTSNTLTDAVLVWDTPLAAGVSASGPTGTVQTSDGASAFQDLGTNNYLNYASGVLNIQPAAGEYQINGTSVLTADTLGSGITNINGTITGLTINNTITTPSGVDLRLDPAGAGNVVFPSNLTSPARIELEDQQGTPNVISVGIAADNRSSYSMTLPEAVQTPGDMLVSFASDYTTKFINNKRTLVFSMDGGGVTPLQVGPKGFVRVFGGPYTITDATLLLEDADTQNITVQVQSVPFASYTGSGSSFTNVTNLSITAGGVTAENTGLSFSLGDGDIIDFSITSATNMDNIVFASVSLTLVPVALTLAP
jgi:hypothetical protein